MGSFSLKKKRQNSPGWNEVPEEKPSSTTGTPERKADDIPKTFGHKGKRVALIVTAPLGSSFEHIAEVIGGKPPPSPPVDWDSRESDALPNLTSRLKFTTHYALCVIDSERWDDTSLALKERFTGAKFWDHPGDSTKSASSRSSASNSSREPAELNSCVVWDIVAIKEIDSGQEIGRTDMSDEEISEVYMNLRRDWKYMPVFWNCHDLAIRLTYLIVAPSQAVGRFLRKLMGLLQQAYYTEVDLFPKACKVAIGGWVVSAVGTVASIPPLAIVGGGIYMAGWSVGFLGGFASYAKFGIKKRYMRKLEERFPELRSLHGYCC